MHTMHSIKTIIYSLSCLCCLWSQDSTVSPGFRDQPGLVWSGGKRIRSLDFGRALEIADQKTGKEETLEEPESALGLTYRAGVATTCRLVDRTILVSQQRLPGLWENFPIDFGTFGRDEFFGLPSKLYQTESGSRFFVMDVMPGFSKGRDASICSWWRQTNAGVFKAEALIPISLDAPVFQSFRPAGPGGAWMAQVALRYRGLLPFLEFPVQVKGAFLVVSWNAGIIWVIKDEDPWPSRTIKLLPLDDDCLSGRKQHSPVLLGIQPMPNDRVLVAMRTRKAIEDSIRSETAPKSTVAQQSEGLALDQIEWKEVDPFEGRVGEPDPAILERAPTSWPVGETLPFGFDLAGRLMLLQEGPRCSR